MSRVRCPKCSTVVEVAPGESPVCPSCGFGRPEGAAAPSAPPAPAPAPVSGPPSDPSPAPLAGPAPDPWDSTPDHGYGAPTAPGAAAPRDGGEPGQLREPGIIVLLYIVTLGIYGLVWHWKTGVEVDRFRPETRASGAMKTYVWTAVAAYALIAVAFIAIGGAFFAALADAAVEDRDPTEGELFDAIVGASFGFFLLLLAFVVGVVSEIFKYVGLWRVWHMTAGEQRRIGVEPLNPTLLLLFVLSPLILNFVQLPFAFIPFLGPFISFLLSIGMIVLLILAYVWTQGGLNQVWRAHGAR